jgi:hypothetical protein
MNRWEVFHATDGIPVYTFRWRWMARVVSRLTRMDFARHGEGWA